MEQRSIFPEIVGRLAVFFRTLGGARDVEIRALVDETSATA